MRRRFTSQQNISSRLDINNYLTIEALEDDFFVTTSVAQSIEYCVDGDGNWRILLSGGSTKNINAGQTLSFRGELASVSQGIGTFTIAKQCNLKGNCMSILFGDNAADNYSLEGKYYVFFRLFYNCSNIVSVSSNFLPATTLATGCYDRMFCGCANLTTAPELPATTLANNCYDSMFYDCSKLNYIKMLATDISASNCLWHWVSSVSSTGTFVKNRAMTSLPTGISGIPIGWTVVNA